MDKRLVEEFLNENFPGGPLNSLQQAGAADIPGMPGGNYSNMLAAELFGSAAFATQIPTSPEHQKMPAMMFDQAMGGLSRMRLIGQQQVEAHLTKLANELTEKNRANDAVDLFKVSNNVTPAAVPKLLTIAETLSKDKALQEISDSIVSAAAYLMTLEG